MVNHESKTRETSRVGYLRRDKCGHILQATAIFYDNGTHRFQQTDGWELNPWDFEPSDAEIQFARARLSHDNTERGAHHHIHIHKELEDQLAYDALTIPDCIDKAFQKLGEMARLITDDFTPRYVFSLLDELRPLNDEGGTIIQDLINVKNRFRSWLSRIEDFEMSLWTFDERVQGRALAVAVGREG